VEYFTIFLHSTYINGDDDDDDDDDDDALLIYEVVNTI